MNGKISKEKKCLNFAAKYKKKSWQRIIMNLSKNKEIFLSSTKKRTSREYIENKRSVKKTQMAALIQC